MKLSVKLIEAGNEFIATCQELDINCYGPTKEKALGRIKNVLLFYIDSAKELGLIVDNFEAISIDGEHTIIPNETYQSKTNAIN
ncbi:MAG: hypothetical protein SVZ03_16725 [Spirochaetota bacterium]|nr:hypothetical protein [Spirochaetota bacterium]